jgi:dipeptidyl-peptidase-4
MKRTLLAVSGFLVLAAPAAAQIPERLDRALTAIYARNEYRVEGFGPVVWLDNGSRYVTVDEAGLTARDTASGAATLLATAAELRPAGAIAAASFSTDASQVLLFTNTRRVWRLNTRGDYWVFDLRTHRLKQVGRDAPASTLMFAKFSPEGSRVAYVRQQNLYVEDLGSGRVTALTAGGSRDIINGTAGLFPGAPARLAGSRVTDDEFAVALRWRSSVFETGEARRLLHDSGAIDIRQAVMDL